MSEAVSGAADAVPGTSPQVVSWGLWSPCISGEAHWHVTSAELPIPIWRHPNEREREHVFFNPVDALGEYFGEHYCADEYVLPDGWVSSWEVAPYDQWLSHKAKAVPEALAEDLLVIYRDLAESDLYCDLRQAGIEHMYAMCDFSEDYDEVEHDLTALEERIVRLQDAAWFTARKQLRRKLRTRAGRDLLTWMETQ